MGEYYRDSIAASFRLLEQYKKGIRQNLVASGLTEEDADLVMSSLELDRGLYFSLNRKYQQFPTALRQFCIDEDFSEGLSDRFESITGHLYEHQVAAIRSIKAGQPTVISTGTGSGKTEAFLLPIIDYCLKHPGPGVKALIIYPMNALANDQVRRIADATRNTNISFGVYTRATPENQTQDTIGSHPPNQRIYRADIRITPPDILITNNVMLDWMLTRKSDAPIFSQSSETLKYIVLDEIHVYRGNKATHLKYLLRRLRHHLKRTDVVPIGASATLSSESTSIDAVKRDFILPLLDVTDCKLILPVFRDDTPETVTPLPENLNPATLVEQFDIDKSAVQQNLNVLTGQKFTFLSTPKPYQAMRESEFVEKIRQALIRRGSQTFIELVHILEDLRPSLAASGQSEKIAQAFLSTICHLNEIKPRLVEPVLDFRAHLFVQNIGGYLKRCLHCHRYHSGRQTYCHECGTPLFPVYARDIRKCVAKVVAGRISFNIEREPGEPKNAFFVLISTNEKIDPGSNTLRFSDDWYVENGRITLNHIPDGSILLEPLHIAPTEINAYLIKLVGGQKDYHNLHALVDAALDLWGISDRKLLGFIDNRERASRYASILRDEFADEFLTAYLRWKYPRETPLDLERTLIKLHQDWDTDSPKLPEHGRAIVNELDLWYYRFTGMPARNAQTQHDVFKLKEGVTLTDIEKDLLGAFLSERAIQKPGVNDINGHYIKFQTHYARTHRGIHTHSGQKSKVREYPSLSFSANARDYSWIIQRYGADVVKNIIEHSLVDRDWISQGTTPDHKTHYYLNPANVVLSLPEPDVSSIDELVQRYLRVAALHSSELTSADRQKAEADFTDGRINFLLATPTLEMGIDIGKLRSVLMIGAPPTPANYAQRAGRAGRKGNFALIITFCEDDDDHDAYYFRNPKLMIDGIIVPPHFNAANLDTIKKHINAFVLAGHTTSRRAIDTFLHEYDANTESYERDVVGLFGDNYPDARTYVNKQLRTDLRHHLDQPNTPPGGIQKALYDCGFFPDYGFRHDQVSLINQEAYDHRMDASAPISDFSISDREPEIAYKQFVPGQRRFTAGDVFEITKQGASDLIGDMNGVPVISYRYLFAKPHDGYATKEPSGIIQTPSEQFEIKQSFVDKRRVLQLAYDPNCTMLLRNICAVEAEEGVQPLDFVLGYDLKRGAIVLAFEQRVCEDESLPLSTLSALERTIKAHYLLDQSELRVAVNYLPKSQSDQDSKTYALMYDFDGNGNVPLGRIFREFDQIIIEAYERLCECLCKSGCYNCLLSYSAHFYNRSPSKQAARMFLGYLAGREYFLPSIKPPDIKTESADLTLSISRSASSWVVTTGTQKYQGEQAPDATDCGSLYNLITCVIRSEFKEGMKSICISTDLDWLIGNINGQNKPKKEDRDAFALLQFNLMRFISVKAKRIS